MYPKHLLGGILSSTHTQCPVLIYSPAVPVWEFEGKLIIDRKFYDGVICYCNCWPGRIRIVARVMGLTQWPLFGCVHYDPENDPFELICLPGETDNLSPEHLQGVDIVMASADSHHNLHVAAMCRSYGVPCIYDIENTLRSRLQQMAYQEADNPLRLIKKGIWLLLTERRRRKAIAQATSVQTSGIPAFESYAKCKPDALLFFDNRMTAETCIDQQALEARLRYLDTMQPLRLAFTGRLMRIKGASDLIDVAVCMQQRRIPFEFHIFGTGELEQALRDRVVAESLGDRVHLHGSVDFQSELLPFLQNHVDVFVCCHRQGDPSCTYLETYGCGIPIAGYANEAFHTMLQKNDVGWEVAMNDVDGLAKVIGMLSADREQIRRKSRTALTFARNNLFEENAKQRMAHCAQFIGPVSA